jgi:hypothetical protein
MRFTVWQHGHGTATLANNLEFADIGPPEQVTITLTVWLQAAHVKSKLTLSSVIARPSMGMKEKTE